MIKNSSTIVKDSTYLVYVKHVRQNKESSARGSGGISVLIHDKLMNTGLVKRIFHKFMECVVLYVDKYLFSGDKDIIMIFVYVSPEKSPFDESNRVNGIEDLSEKLTIISSDYPDAHLLLAGDFNARTKDIDDFIINDDIEHIFEKVVDYPHDNFNLPRKSKNMLLLNKFGQSLIELCCTRSVHILNGRINGDLSGDYTCFANDGKSIVDYIVVSTQLFKNVKCFNVENVEFSDHFPLVCKLEFETDKCLNNNFESHNAGNEIHQQYKWNETLKDDFLHNFLTTFNTYFNSMGFPLTNIENELEKFQKCFYKSAGNMKKKCLYNDNYSLKNPAWWNEECQRLKQLRLYSLRKYRNCNKNDNFLQYKIVRNKFQAKCKQSLLNLERENRSKLVRFRKNAKTFWNLIRTPTKRYDKSSNVSYKEWVDHF